MSFGNLQKMALQMQQNMQRVEEELRGRPSSKARPVGASCAPS